MAEQLWHEREPERLEFELEQLRKVGLEPELLGPGSERRIGIRVVIADHRTGATEPLPITIAFPYEYPLIPPTLSTTATVIDRHQNPDGGNFCLLEDHDRDWHPDRSAAEMVGLLQQLLADHACGPEAVREGEAAMPEPVSAYLDQRCEHDAAVLVPDPFFAPVLSETTGTMSLKLPEHGQLALLHSAVGIGTVDAMLARCVAGSSPRYAHGFWFALGDDESPLDIVGGGTTLRDWVTERSPTCAKRINKLAKSKGSNELWIGLTFFEEGPKRGERRRSWLFLRLRFASKDVDYVRAQALTRGERERRTPELVGLDACNVLLIGAGSLGAPVACELAKAGVGKIRIVDADQYDVNNAVRHTLPITTAGQAKCDALAAMCKSLNPFVDAMGICVTIGTSARSSDELARLIDECDLAIDTTGDQGVARIMARRCSGASKPLIVAGLSRSSYGGDIVHLAGFGPCLECFFLAQADGQIPEPRAGARSDVTPIGCRHPAFAGAGFEATELGAHVARMAANALPGCAYPPPPFDWAVFDFRGSPHRQQGRLKRHPDCRNHDR